MLVGIHSLENKQINWQIIDDAHDKFQLGSKSQS